MELILLKYFCSKLKCVEVLNNKYEFRISIDQSILLNVIYFFKFSSLVKFETLLDLFGVDYKNYLQVNYYLLSLEKDCRLLLKLNLIDNFVNSLNLLYKSSNWLERELWDMYGIYINGNEDLRRILTDYGFDGFPLLKIFPLSGYFELFYTNEAKRVIMKNIELTQQYRLFEFQTPWKTVIK